MPNWCGNALGVTGPAEDIAKFVEAIRHPDGTPEDDNEWDLSRLAPMPKILEGTRSPCPTPESIASLREKADDPTWPHVTLEYVEADEVLMVKGHEAFLETGYQDWYSWCADTWGTKWCPRVHTIEVEETAVSMVFDSAWAPPTGLIALGSATFPTLTFILEYSEPGMGFLGAEAFRGGDEIASKYFNDAADDPVMGALHAALNQLQDDPDYDGDEEEAFHDRIQNRWTVLQERCGADVSEAVHTHT